MDQNKQYSRDMFEFVQSGVSLHDEKLKTKSRSYFADAFIRFRKNKSSVVAAFIIGFLILFSILAPLISPYTVNDTDNVYSNYPPFIRDIADMNLGVLDGAQSYPSQNAFQMAKYQAIAKETGYNPILKSSERIVDGKTVYSLTVNRYYAYGVRELVMSYEKFAEIQQWQVENNIIVILPYVDNATDPNVWYKTTEIKVDRKMVTVPEYDANGNFIPNYDTNTSKAGPVEVLKRIEGDDGSYVYSRDKSNSVTCRVCYYNYYRFMNGREPTYVFGTDSYGRCLFDAIGTGARFSLVFAVIVSAINLTIGAIYGAIQGYYGGFIDLALDRISDVLSGVPTIVVMTLFQLHLAQKVGVVPSFLFAYVMTGWIGMAALTRKQFYRFKSQEYVLAARTLGASDKRLMFKHIFPNSLGTMVTSCVLVIPGVISSETTLTYLGIVDLSTFVGTSIGELMELGQKSMSAAPHAMLFPALFLSLLLISFNLFGNGLRDAFNPSTRGVDD
ncbi:MAG: ABC transporter permease [Clostridia bacterium]|nr:ABC transporter permease [Clostridia bacterium]